MPAPLSLAAARRRIRNGTYTRADVEAILRARNAPEDRFALHAMAVLDARIARTGCRFACAERGVSIYCPDHAPKAH